MRSAILLFIVFLVLGIASSVVFWRVPSNQYEWMQTDPVVGSPLTKLPHDQDESAFRFLLTVPVIAIAIANLTNAVLRLRGVLRVTAIGFSIFLAGIVAIRLAVP